MSTGAASRRLLLTALCALTLVGCDLLSSGSRGDGAPAGPLAGDSNPSTGGGGAGGGPEMPAADPPKTAPPGTSVVWKRGPVAERDLMRALELAQDELCVEPGGVACARAHLASLGGNEPFDSAQYTRIAEPSAVTPTALDRLVLGACAARVAADRRGKAEVFTTFPLDAPAKPDDDAFVQALDAQHTALFRRLLARDPSAEELAELRALARDETGAPLSGADLATLGCYVIGTHAEFVFL